MREVLIMSNAQLDNIEFVAKTLAQISATNGNVTFGTQHNQVA